MMSKGQHSLQPHGAGSTHKSPPSKQLDSPPKREGAGVEVVAAYSNFAVDFSLQYWSTGRSGTIIGLLLGIFHEYYTGNVILQSRLTSTCINLHLHSFLSLMSDQKWAGRLFNLGMVRHHMRLRS